MSDSGIQSGNIAELSDIEKLAIAQAFYKAVADIVATKNTDNLRGRADAYYRDLYEQTGAKSFDVKLFGGKVGTYSVTVTKPTDSTQKVELDVTDEGKLFEWAMEHDFVSVDMKAVNAYFTRTGEVPEGCEPRIVITPGTPGGDIKSTSLRIDEHAVLDAIGPQLESVSHMMLEGGE